LNGTPLNEIGKIKAGIIVIGNESKGINKELLNRCTHNVTIPRLGKAESLNAAVATGIICHSLLC
jgi:TrmH family RNA methyltransferase